MGEPTASCNATAMRTGPGGAGESALRPPLARLFFVLRVFLVSLPYDHLRDAGTVYLLDVQGVAVQAQLVAGFWRTPEFAQDEAA